MAATNPIPRQIRLSTLARLTITTWRLRLTTLKIKISMDSIAVPTRLPRATSRGTMEGITNMTRLNRLTRMTRMTRRPILTRLDISSRIPGGLARIGRLLLLGRLD